MKAILSLGVGTQSTYIALGLTEEYKLQWLHDLYPNGIISIFAYIGSEMELTDDFLIVNDTMDECSGSCFT